MPDGDDGLAKSVYLAQMFAQRGTCQCEACQLLRKATDGMISQVLGGAPSEATKVMSDLVKQAALPGTSQDPGSQEET